MRDQKEIVLYTRRRSWGSWRARRLLGRNGYAFEVVDTTDDFELREWLQRSSGRDTAPQLFVDGRLVGDFDVVRVLDDSGNFDRLVRGSV